MAYHITITGDGTATVMANFLEIGPGSGGSVGSWSTDGSNAAVGTNIGPSSGNVTTSSAASIIVATVESATGGLTVTAGTAYTLQNNNTDFRSFADEFRTVGAATTNPAFNFSSSADFACAAQGFKNTSIGSAAAVAQKKVDSGAGTSCTVTPTSAPTNGNLLVLIVRTLQNSATPTISLVDSAGQTWVQGVRTPQEGDGSTLTVYYILAANAAGVPNSLMLMGCGT
jgi:hypothetical protein